MKMICKLWRLSFVVLASVCIISCNKDDEKSDETTNNESITDNTVDLGLKSGVKWAKMNVEAKNSFDYGLYYAWGETEIKTKYDSTTYKYCDGTYDSFTKYCGVASYGSNGFTDVLTTLESADNIAVVKLGANYTIPTTDDWNELSSQCYWVWTSNYNGQNVNGYVIYKAKSDSDKGVKVYAQNSPSVAYSLSDIHIFLPAAGRYDDSGLNNVGECGYYWSASLREDCPEFAQGCYFSSKFIFQVSSGCRGNGLSVRPIRRN